MLKRSADLETICACATAPGIGAIAAIRLSGSQSLSIARKIAPFLPAEPTTHRAYYGWLKENDSENKNVDEVLALFFEEGKSFTGDTSIEFFCHGSPLIVQKITNLLIQNGARAAQPGEFSYRAFMNNKIDLAQAEAIHQLISSQSESSLDLSLRQLSGELSLILKQTEEKLIWVLSRLEANIDFAQEDIEFEKPARITDAIATSLATVRKLLSTYKAGKLLKNGINVALIGPPNVGKSSLLNALLNEDKSIVSCIPGTTRDCVEGQLLHKGVVFNLVDTAGIHNTEDEIEKIGIRKSMEAIQQSDVVLQLIDANSETVSEDLFAVLFNEQKPTLKVFTKMDLLTPEQAANIEIESLGVSSLKGLGLDNVLGKIFELFMPTDIIHDTTLMNARHYEELLKAEYHLTIAKQLSEEKDSPEFIISDTQEALFALMRIIGKQYDEEITDKIFKDFCLGK